MQLLAPAKVNVSFRIFRRRPDGFHEIETVMSRISLYDTVRIDRNDSTEIVFHCDEPSLPLNDDNLVVRAARAFFSATSQRPGVSIELNKRIPHGAGLGGGSSDAATTLLALNQLCGTRLSREELARLAGEIGADVPFFIYESAALCRGRGEVVEPLKLAHSLPLLLLKPAFGVDTRWAYEHWETSCEIPDVRYTEQNFTHIQLVNDLERPVFEKFVFLAKMKTWLLAQPETAAALMSGSGSTVFAVLNSDASADVLADRARREIDPELWTFACRTIDD
jgi:4-diphosphocytidyl-2-C-methyl-D-erythritol kinase